MPISGCPGQDKRFWKPDDIHEAPCPHCGAKVEFWKDDRERRCKACGRIVANPKFDLGCAKWCKHAESCVPPKKFTAETAENAEKTEKTEKT